MIIGVDCDEPLAQLIDALVTWHNKTYTTTFTKPDHTDYLLSKIWGGTPEEAYQKVFDFYHSPDFELIEPTPGSVKATQQLAQKHTLYVITSRPIITKQKTLQWIQKHYGQTFADIYFSGEFNSLMGKEMQGLSKGQICNELEVDIYIEDNIEYAQEVVDAGVPVLLFDAPWNNALTTLPQDMTRVSTWEEITDDVKKLAL